MEVRLWGWAADSNPSTLTLNFASLPEVSSDDEIMELLIVVID